MLKKVKIAVFFIFVLFFFILVGTFNYLVDFHHVLRKAEYMRLLIVPDNLIHFCIERHKNIKNRTLLVGFSEPEICLGDKNYQKKFFNQLFVLNVNYINLYDYLEHYLNLHPETKVVKFFVSYNPFFIYHNTRKSYTTTGYKDKIFYLLFSKYVTGLNFEYLCFLTKNKIMSSKYTPKYISQRKFIMKYHPDYLPALPIKIFEEKKKENFEYIKKILDLLKSKNIDYEIIIPQYNAIYLAAQQELGVYDKTEEIKRFLIDNANVVYDFAYVNRLTKTKLKGGENYIYMFPDHPNENFGYKLYKFLFFRKDSDDSIYIKLTPQNIDFQLKKEKKLLDEYMNENREYVKSYMNSNNREKIEYFDTRKMPKEFFDDKEYIERYLN